MAPASRQHVDVIGLAGAFAIARLMRGLLYGVGPADSLSIGSILLRHEFDRLVNPVIRSLDKYIRHRTTASSHLTSYGAQTIHSQFLKRFQIQHNHRSQYKRDEELRDFVGTIHAA